MQSLQSIRWTYRRKLIIGVLCVLLSLTFVTIQAAAPDTSVTPLSIIVQADSASWLTVKTPFTGDANSNSYTSYEHSPSSSGPWSRACSLTLGESLVRVCRFAANPLTPNTDYYLRITFADPDGVNGSNPRIIGPIHTAATAVNAVTIGQVSATVRDTYILVSLPDSQDANQNSYFSSVDSGSSASGPWTARCASKDDNGAKLCGIHGLVHNTSYWLRVTVTDADGVNGTNPQIIGPIFYSGQTNLALGKTVTADPGWGCCSNPAELTDGRTQSSSFTQGFSWAGGINGYGSTAGWKQATIDLGSVQTVARVDVSLHQSNTVPTDWQVLASTDGTAFTEVFSTTSGQCTVAGSSDTNVSWGWFSCQQTARFPATQARYLRYSFDDRSLRDGMHGWALEIEAFGPQLAQWSQIDPMNSNQIPGRMFALSAYDQAHDRLMLFGGSTTVNLADSWVLSNASGVAGAPTWTKLTPTGSVPPIRAIGSAVYDPISNRLIIFGGCANFCAPALNDVWALTNANGLGGTPGWVQLANAPFARVGHFAGYDAASNRMIIFGGQEAFPNTDKNDVWVVSNANGLGGTSMWAKLNTTGGPPPARGNVNAAYDPVSNRLIVVSGCTAGSSTVPTIFFNDVWVLSNANGSGEPAQWTQLTPEGGAPAPHCLAAAHYDSTSNRFMLSAGWNRDEPDREYFNDTWLLTNANGIGGTPQWIQLGTTDGPPAPRFVSASAYATVSNRLMLVFGGNADMSPTLRDESWILTNANGLDSQPVLSSIAGSVREGGSGLAGVLISDRAGHTATTDSAGNYMLASLLDGSYTLTATKADYRCNPASLQISVPPSKIGQDFSCSPLTYAISGSVRTNTNVPLSGVTISDTTGHTTTTDASGNYTLSNLRAGYYTLTPTKSGSTFIPATRTMSVPPAATGQDFQAQAEESGGSWTFMLYLAGDNNLATDLRRAIREMEAQAPNPRVKIVVLFDGDRQGDSRRFIVQPGGSYTPDVNTWAMGELNMGDPQTLSQFIRWARTTLPSDHYYLAIADHGRGTSGVAWDDRSALDYLTTSELNEALGDVTFNGQQPIDILHYDTCLMAMLENAYLVQDYAHYLIASENLGWSLFGYASYMQAVTDQSTPRQLTHAIATRYFQAPSLQSYPRTISVVDTGQAVAVRQALDQLAGTLTPQMSSLKIFLQLARDSSQKFDSRDFYRITRDDEYVDLYDLAVQLKQAMPDATAKQDAQKLMDAVQAMVIVEYHQSGSWDGRQDYWNLDNAHGLAIYFPPRSGSQDYNNYTDHQMFTQFTADSQWDELLKAYFNALVLLPERPVEPERPPMLTSPTRIYLPGVVW